MHTATRFIRTVALVTSVLLASGLAVFGSASATTINLPAVGNVAADDGDDDKDEPDVKARVGRISFIHGTAKVRHAGDKDWTVVTLNLPVVEGDELVTDEDSRIEVQFDKWQHMRLEENSYLKVTTLRDEGIAVSINIGTMNVRITSFDKSRQFFEIDAPKSTIAVEKAGSFRVDAGREGSTEVRASIKAGGEARIYSDTAGFTLKNDRSAKIFVDGPNAGEWETADAGKLADDFDAWTLDRDDKIAKRLKSASYGVYYDDDIYGADDLTDYGQWVYTRDYGWIWKPFPQAVSTYADWTPYRYGQWSWVPPFGWVWVNDEPWGWATYHHGRWIYVNSGWYWTPYGYYRPARSWWFPALVAINITINDICWYPLGYHHHYQRFNDHGGGWHPHDTRGPTHHDTVPAGGVVAVDRKKFTVPRGPRKASEDQAVRVLNGGGSLQGSLLPTRLDAIKVSGPGQVIDPPVLPKEVDNRQIGAGTRKVGVSIDEELKRSRMYGGREVLRLDTPTGLGSGLGTPEGVGIGAANGTGIGAANGNGIGNSAVRQTGVVKRDPGVRIKQPDPQPVTDGGDKHIVSPIKPVMPGDNSGRDKVEHPGETRGTRPPIKSEPPPIKPSGSGDREVKRDSAPVKVEKPADKQPAPPKKQEETKKEAPVPSKVGNKGKPDGGE